MVKTNGEVHQERPGSGSGFNPIGPVHRRLSTLAGQSGSIDAEIVSLFRSLEHTIWSDSQIRNLTLGADGFLYGLECGPIGPRELVRLRSFLIRTVDGNTKASVADAPKKATDAPGCKGEDGSKSMRDATFAAMCKWTEASVQRGHNCTCPICQIERVLAGTTFDLVEIRFDDKDAAPLVKTGPGGDFTTETKPSDLAMSKAARACLMAIDHLKARIDSILPKKSPHDAMTAAAQTPAVGTQSPSDQ
jgi:hypothetical protein